MLKTLLGALLLTLPLSLLAQSAGAVKKPVQSAATKNVPPAKTRQVLRHSQADRPAATDATLVSPVGPTQILTEAELALAERVYVGHLPCELGASVTVSADPKAAGHFWVQLKQQRFHMIPVDTSTGAIRLEDRHAGTVWLQLANKSMLMSQKHGRRLVDACMNPEQTTTLEAMRRENRPTIFDQMGMPAGAVAMRD